MSDPTATTMDAIEIGDFLKSQRTGVLSLANDDEGYGVPVSFTYDDEDPSIYLRLGYAPGSRKKKFVEASDRVTFVVYADTDEGWKSVLAEGRLEELSESNLGSSIVEATHNLDIPYFRVHERPAVDLEFSIVRLDIQSLSGVVEG